MTIPLVETPLVIVPADTLAKLESMGPDLQDVIGRTRSIENQLRRSFSFQTRDRAPQTVMVGSGNFSADPAVAGGEVAAGSTVILADYEVPEHRVGEVCHLDLTVRVIVALAAGQALMIATQLLPPSGGAAIPMRVQHGLATGAGGVVTISTSGSHWLTPRWRAQCIASLGAGVGTMRAQGSIMALEYNLAGD